MKKRIAFFQDDLLGPGGIQKSLFNLLHNLDYDRVDVTLFLFEEGCYFPGGLPKELTVVIAPKPPRVCSFMPFDMARRFWKHDWKQYGEFDLAADFNSYQFSCACGALGVRAKNHVMWLHNNVEIKLHNEWKYRVLWHFFQGKLKYYDRFIPCSKALIEPFIRVSGLKDACFTVIQNYIDIIEIRAKQKTHPEIPNFDVEKMNFAALGRLCHQKGYDIMIELFARACQQRDDLMLYIIGGGYDRRALGVQAEQQAPGKIVFLGEQSNPYSILDRMDAFLSTSRYEGQPLNIEEARAIGLPLYCTKNLEQYSEGLQGYEPEELLQAIVNAKKQPKKPDNLEEYNREILEKIYNL